MAADLDKVMNVKGVVSAIEFTPDGRVIQSKGNMDKRVEEMMADLCSANLRMARMQAHLFTEESGAFGFGSELTGFAMMGTELAICVIENVGVLVKQNETNLNQIYEVLASI